MGETVRGHQLEMEGVVEHEEGTTHHIIPQASVKVESRNGKGFAWAVVIEAGFDVQRRPKEEEPRHEARMGLFHALQPFTVTYPRYGSRVPYPGGTRLYAFLKPEDNTVIPVKPVAYKK